MRKPKGHIRKRPFGYEIAVPEGRDPITKRYRYRYAYADTIEGLLHPELTAAATRGEAASIAHRQFSAHASVNRTCEIAMTRATGTTYHHLLELVEHATR